MIDHSTLDEIVRKIGNALPDSARSLQQDIEKNIRATMSTMFEKMDLVTREELDVQKAVLARTRAKVDALEKKIAELEKDTIQNQD